MQQALSKALVSILAIALLSATSACGDDEHHHDADAGADDADAGAGAVPTSYTFDSRFNDGESAVSYSGQVFRHVLVSELTTYLAGLTDAVDTAPPADDDVLAALNFYFDFDSSTSGSTPLALTTDPPLMQSTFDDISSDKNLRSKLAGNDATTDHMEWNTPGNFDGWTAGGEDTDTPTELVQYWFGLIDDIAYARGQGTVGLDPDGAPITEAFITDSGHDLRQLVQKFLLGAIAFSQGTDDYLDDATDGKGLLASNLQDEDNAYSALEHAWDEGYGYFGAARDFADYTDDELSVKGGRDDYQGYHDTDSDGFIDLKSELSFGNSINCAKRDRGSDVAAATDYTQDAFDAFLAGRHLIWSIDGELDAAQLDELRGYRDTIEQTWEDCVAATLVHYINEVLADMDTFDGDYSFADHVKHWSELKGFALGLQFNPRSPMNDGTRFGDFHALIADAPVLPNDVGGPSAIADYRTDLESARAILAEAYGFDALNIAGW
jgi:hypothetical protein